METNLGNNRYWSRIIWHTMKEIPEESKEVIFRFNGFLNVLGYISSYYNELGDLCVEFWDTREKILSPDSIVAWGEFEFPQDWDYNK